jgi:AraC-like DNA-binding protein
MTGQSIMLALNAIGVGVSLTALCTFFIAHRFGPVILRRARVWMGVFIALLGYDHALGAAEALDLYERSTHLIGAELLHLPWLVLALHQHVRLVTAPPASDAPAQGPALNAKLWWGLPALWLLLVPLAILDGELKHAVFGADAQGVSLEALPSDDAICVLWAVLGVFIYWLIWLVGLGVAGVLMVRRLVRRERWLRATVSSFEGLGVSPLRRLLWLCATGVGLTVVDQLLEITGAPALPDWAADLYVLGLGACFYGLMLGAMLEPVQGFPGPAPEIQPSPPARPAYARSALTEADVARILQKIEAAMRDGQLWRDPFFNLSALSKACGVKPHQISQTLNAGLGRSFFDYVNGLRVEEARILLEQTHDTILSVSEAVGFNSKSTFNAAFLKHARMTPSQYRTSMRRRESGPDAGAAG